MAVIAIELLYASSDSFNYTKMIVRSEATPTPVRCQYCRVEQCERQNVLKSLSKLPFFQLSIKSLISFFVLSANELDNGLKCGPDLCVVNTKLQCHKLLCKTHRYYH